MRKVQSSFRIFAFVLFFVSFTSVIPTNSFASLNLPVTTEPANPSSNEAIIILSTVNLQEMQYARKIVEQYGGRVKTIFPPSVFVANLPLAAAQTLRSMDNFESISYEGVDPSSFKEYEPSTADAVRYWNKKVANPNFYKTSNTTSNSSIPSASVFCENAEINSEPPTSSAEVNTVEKTYIAGWQERKQELLFNEEQKRQEWQQKRQELGKKVFSFSADGEAMEKSFAESQSATSSNFGKANGAGFFDTSLYLIGDVAVGIFFPGGTGGPWTQEQVDEAFDSTAAAISEFADDEPNAKLTFTVIKEVNTSPTWSVKPLPLVDYRSYINDIRNVYQTHWSYMVRLYNGGGRGSALLFGPRLNIFSWELWDGAVVRHETMHVFGAVDQYGDDSPFGPTGNWGYLSVVNANSIQGDGTGYFAGAGEGDIDIMLTGVDDRIIGPYSRGQIGWRDSDGDGILDPLDVDPDNAIISKSGTNPLTYTGVAKTRPLFNQIQEQGAVYNSAWKLYGDVDLNTITSVEYRINQSAWQEAIAVDGAFDNGIESFSFTTPSLTNGKHTVEVRAINSSGNVQTAYSKDTIYVQGSATTNTRPFGAIAVNPSVTSVGNVVTFDASASTDFETPAASLRVRFDYDNNGAWDRGFSTVKTATTTYATPGPKTVRMEVWDLSNLGHIVTKTFQIAAVNVSPTPVFSITPENQQGEIAVLPVTLNATSSWDGEDSPANLQVRWDFEDDGIWDTGYSNTLSTNHNYSLTAIQTEHFKPRFELIDSDNNVTQATSDIWSNTYNHSPSISGLNAVYQEGDLKVDLFSNFDTAGTVNDTYVVGQYAFLADGSAGLKIVNIKDPYNPLLKGSIDTSGTANGVFVKDNYAYVADGASGLQIVNISNPATPVLLGSYNTPSSAMDVFVKDNFAYVADGTTLQIINISNPNSPVLAGSITTVSSNDVFISGNYAFVTETGNGLRTINVSNPTSPTLARSTPELGNLNGVYVRGIYAYLSEASSGLQVLDVTYPEIPVSVGSYAIPNGVDGIHVSENLAYLVTNNASTPSLMVFDITGTSPVLVARLDQNLQSNGIFVKNNFIYTASGASGMKVICAMHRPTPSLASSTETGDLASDVVVKDKYAYVADGAAGLQIINIQDKLRPVTLSVLDTTGFAIAIDVAGNYAYVADSASGLQIFDISNPSVPVLIGTYCPSAGCATQEVVDVQIVDNYAYVIDKLSGLKILNISNPASPALVGSYNTVDTELGVFVTGPYAYIAAASLGVQIVNVSNPAAPWLRGSYDTPNFAAKVFVYGRYAYVADGYAGLQVIDIINPAFPILVGSFDTPAYANDIVVQGQFAYVADQDVEPLTAFPEDDGLNVIDVSVPSSPVLISRFDRVAEGNAATGLFVEGLHVYVADGLDGLQIVNAGPSLRLSASASDADSSTTWDGTIKYRWNLNSDNWDTPFTSASTIDIPATDELSSVICEVKDRFSAVNRLSSSLNIAYPPRLVPINAKTIDAGNSLTFQVNAGDVNGGALTFSATGLPSGATFNSSSGQFTWLPSTTQIGNYSVTFYVSDGQLTDSETITITVSGMYMPDPTRRSGCSASCFVKGTPIIMANGSRKAIEKVRVGDSVLAYDEETKGFKADKVTEFFEHKADKYYIINKRLKVTEEHPVYANGEWIEAGKLKTGDQLLGVNGKSETITSIKVVKKKVNVFNLEVNPFHTYVAGGVVVHNKASGRCQN